MADEIQSAIDADTRSLERAVAVAKKALQSSHPGLRSRAVCALGDFGKDGLPQIAAFLGDPDPDVAKDAADLFAGTLGDFENDQDKADLIRMAMASITDEDALSVLDGFLDGIDPAIAVDAIIGIVSDGGAGADAAKEAYARITGDDWSGADAARDWIDEKAAEDAQAAAAEGETMVIRREDGKYQLVNPDGTPAVSSVSGQGSVPQPPAGQDVSVPAQP